MTCLVIPAKGFMSWTLTIKSTVWYATSPLEGLLVPLPADEGLFRRSFGRHSIKWSKMSRWLIRPSTRCTVLTRCCNMSCARLAIHHCTRREKIRLEMAKCGSVGIGRLCETGLRSTQLVTGIARLQYRSVNISDIVMVVQMDSLLTGEIRLPNRWLSRRFYV